MRSTSPSLALAVAEELFDCLDGIQRSYHTLDDGTQLPYVTLAFAGSPLRRAAVEAAFVEELRKVRASLPETSRPQLYWRIRPTLSLQRVWRVPLLGHRWVIRARVAIPGVSWDRFTTKPEGAPTPRIPHRRRSN